MAVSNLLYDGTFEGFLSCVFHVYDQKSESVVIQKTNQVQHSFFYENEEVTTNTHHAKRVWKGLSRKLTPKAIYQIYCAFLSETDNVESILVDYIRTAFKSPISIQNDYANPTVLKISQIAKSVNREKHRMEAFVRFRLTKDNIYFASIEPDFNVLPLLMHHFRSRYADQKWIIYDVKRHYGLFYNLENVFNVEITFPTTFQPTKTTSHFFDPEETEFQTLWQDYFNSTNIPYRKNMKLHIQHVPRRYWKYLSEKLPRE